MIGVVILQVNIERKDCQNKLRFFHSVLAPFFESYLVTGHHINKLTDMEIPGKGLFLVLFFIRCKLFTVQDSKMFENSPCLK